MDSPEFQSVAPAIGPQLTQPKRRTGFGTGLLSAIVLLVTAGCIIAFIGLLSRNNPDPGVRVWMLNHTPDQALVINPFDGVIEKNFQVSDGLRELAFSRDFAKAYVAGVVDVSNRLTVLDTRTALKDETIEVDGVPQGIGVFPNNRLLAVVLGSKTDFMAGGFDVIDLEKQSKADPKRKQRLWRVRDLQLTHKIAVGDDGDRIYLIDAKAPLVNVYSFSRKEQVKAVDVHGAPEELLYPPVGKYYYVSVLAHSSIYQLDKRSDAITAVYIYSLPDPDKRYAKRKLRYMALDSKGERLYATNYEDKSIAVWHVDNPARSIPGDQVPPEPSGRGYRFTELTHYFPENIVRLKGGYNRNVAFVPGGKQIMLDPTDEYLFVCDDEGALYIYDTAVILAAAPGSIPEPRKIVPVEVAAVEIRDMKVCRPPLRLGSGKDTRKAAEPVAEPGAVAAQRKLGVGDG
jgi:DNA-binding beta-propeller fold protein YncE